MSFLSENKDEIKKLIEDVAKAENLTIENYRYQINGRYGEGIYMDIKEVPDRNFCYLNDSCHDMASFLDDFMTDIGLISLDKQYNLSSQVTPIGHGTNSIFENKYHGHLGLNEFWDVKTLSFNGNGFNNFAAKIKKQSIGGIRSFGIFEQNVSNVPSGITTLASKAVVDAFIKKINEKNPVLATNQII